MRVKLCVSCILFGNQGSLTVPCRSIRVDAREYLATVELQAREDRDRHSKIFREWAATRIGVDGLALNPASSLQLCTFLFGGAENPKTRECTEVVRVFKVPTEEIPEDALEALRLRDEAAVAKAGEDSGEAGQAFGDLEQMKVAQLKELCKEFGLKLSGKKTDLQTRIREHLISAAAGTADAEDSEVLNMTYEDLCHALRSRGIEVQGTREELLSIYQDDINYLKEAQSTASPVDTKGYVTLCKAMEDAAEKGGAIAQYITDTQQKAVQVPKYIDVTIRSQGLSPEKYTVGGAPSATADVIRKLAGDPFSSPPKYGTVSDFPWRCIDFCQALTHSRHAACASNPNRRPSKRLGKRGAKPSTVSVLSAQSIP